LPYALYHFLRLHNTIIHGDVNQISLASVPPAVVCTSSLLALADPPSPRYTHTQTLKNILHFDADSHAVKSAQHARYDEGMKDVPDPSPNARLDRFAQRGEPFPAESEILETLDRDVSENPFQELRTLSVFVGGEDSHIGFTFPKFSHRPRAYMSELQPNSTAADICNGCRQLVGECVVSIQGRSVFTVEQAKLALTAAPDASPADIPIEFFFAPESRSDAVDFRRPPLHLQLSQLKRIHALRTVSGDELALVSFTRRKLKQHPFWDLWLTP
jgi:hypothetical protein